VEHRVRFTGEPSVVLETAGHFLESRPVEHNLILTLLEARGTRPIPGRYWIVERGDEVVGVVHQWPVDFTATLTPMPREAIHAVVEHIVDQSIALPAVNGEVATVASFAGCWAERTRCRALADSAQRIYALDALTMPDPVPGELRVADRADRDLLVEWTRAFHAEADPGAGAPEHEVDERLAIGALHLWVTDQAVCMAGHRPPIAGVSRIGPVYTPPAARRHGYASACVAMLSQQLIEGGGRCILYADLANPTSNAIYQRMGYRAVTEAIRYRFEPAE
jgi:predicted GNAT family acetyltransferase